MSKCRSISLWKKNNSNNNNSGAKIVGNEGEKTNKWRDSEALKNILSVMDVDGQTEQQPFILLSGACMYNMS